MAGLQRLRLLIRWGNAMGRQPFRMELDPNDGTFRRFEFSWKRWSTWWFVVSFLLYTAATILSQLPQKILSCRGDLPTIDKIAFAIIFNNCTLMALGPYVLIFYWKRLATAVKSVHNFDRIVRHIGSWPCATKRQTVIGITLSTITVRIETLSLPT